jgi:hypothetical protein
MDIYQGEDGRPAGTVRAEGQPEGRPFSGTWSSWPWSRACTRVTSILRALMRSAPTNATGHERTNLRVSPLSIFMTITVRERLLGDKSQDRYCGNRLKPKEQWSLPCSCGGSAREPPASFSLRRPCSGPAVASSTLEWVIPLLTSVTIRSRYAIRRRENCAANTLTPLCGRRSSCHRATASCAQLWGHRWSGLAALDRRAGARRVTMSVTTDPPAVSEAACLVGVLGDNRNFSAVFAVVASSIRRPDRWSDMSPPRTVRFWSSTHSTLNPQCSADRHVQRLE